MLGLLNSSGLHDDLGSLLFEDNAHLLEWKGELVLRSDAPFSSATPESFPTAKLDDYAYKPAGYIPVERDRTQPKEYPNISVRELREMLMPRLGQSSENLAVRGGFSRPNEISAFDFRQEVPEEAGIETLASIWGLDFSFTPDWGKVKASHSGAYWALSRVSYEFLGFDIVPESLLLIFGDRETPEFHKVRWLQDEYLASNQIEQSRIDAAYTNLDKEIKQLEDTCSQKLELANQEINLWLERGKVPVRLANGEIAVALTAVNYGVAFAAIKRIFRLGIKLKGFVLGAREVLYDKQQSATEQ